MPKVQAHPLWIEVGPFTHPPAIDAVSCEKFTTEPGSVLRILEAAGVELDRVLVTIHGHVAGLLERGLAKRIGQTQEWQYTRLGKETTDEGRTVEISAVPLDGRPATTFILADTAHRISFEVRVGLETRRVDIWRELSSQRRRRAGLRVETGSRFSTSPQAALNPPAQTPDPIACARPV